MSNERAKVVTGKVRFSYLNAFEPRRPKNGNGEPVYSVSLVIPKTDTETRDAILNALHEAYEDGSRVLANKSGKVVGFESLKLPLHDGDEKDNDPEGVYRNAWYINATSKYAPVIVDENREDIEDESLVYSGCYGRASLTFFAYNSNGAKGISCGLRALQKLEDGEKLGGDRNYADDFAN